ncbi:hypothetical protein SNEBB_005803 [Seison nebaliae]|nr:hypothetical protein SNEBB_005803 [Seison nebaliae]
MSNLTYNYRNIQLTIILLWTLLVVWRIYGRGKGDEHKLAVIVPYRNRLNQLMKFIPVISEKLNNENIRHELFIIHQSDKYRFNRGALINAGFLSLLPLEFDYIAIHDIDLLPESNLLSYQFPIKSGIFHLSSPNIHPLYNYSTYLGGIVLIKNDLFEKINGMPNDCWGWGEEDDEFYRRLTKINVRIDRSDNPQLTRNNSFHHLHSKDDLEFNEERDKLRYGKQRDLRRKDSLENGLNSLKYFLSSKKYLCLSDELNLSQTYCFHMLNVKLVCNENVEPWCRHPKGLDDRSAMQLLRKLRNFKKLKL